MDDDLEPITAEPVDMTLTLPRGNRQMRLSALAYRWLREARGLGVEDKLSITLAQIKGKKGRFAIVYDADGLVVDPGNYYCSGVALRRLLEHPKAMVRIPLIGNAEKMRLEFDLKAATIQPQAVGAPAARPASVQADQENLARSERSQGADESGPTAQLAAPTGVPSVVTAPCPQCGADGAKQGTLTDYTVKPPRVSALVFSCPNGHRFETKDGDAVFVEAAPPRAPTIDPSGGGVAALTAEVSSAQGGGPAGPPPHAELPSEDVNAIDAILDADTAEEPEADEVDPEWLAALHGETNDNAG